MHRMPPPGLRSIQHLSPHRGGTNQAPVGQVKNAEQIRRVPAFFRQVLIAYFGEPDSVFSPGDQ